MKLNGSCPCRAVRFSVESQSLVPVIHCHCSIRRKTAGWPEESLEDRHRRHHLLSE